MLSSFRRALLRTNLSTLTLSHVTLGVPRVKQHYISRFTHIVSRALLQTNLSTLTRRQVALGVLKAAQYLVIRTSSRPWSVKYSRTSSENTWCSNDTLFQKSILFLVPKSKFSRHLWNTKDGRITRRDS